MKFLFASARPIGCAVMLSLAASTVQAEPIPQEYLDADRKSCNSSCTRTGWPAGFCVRKCECAAKKLGEEITFEEYATIVRAMLAKQEPPSDLMSRVDAISDYCTRQAN